MNYDVIIAGASFAGLAVARELKGKVLLIDRKRIGSGVTSACATTKDWLLKLGCGDSIRQEFPQGVLHFINRDITYEFQPPYCTFDYHKFCQLMRENVEAEVVTANVKGLQGDKVITDKGNFKAPYIVDCTGWRASLASSLDGRIVSRKRLSFGFETTFPFKGEKLHIYLDPKQIKKGILWFFPAGGEGRFGVGSYIGETDLKQELNIFLKKFGLGNFNNLHGGFFPHRLRRSVVRNIFMAGDSAGHCLPLTGEGIRPALFFGIMCGRIIQKILEGEVSLAEAKKEYHYLVKSRSKYYTFLLNFQRLIISVPNSWTAAYAALIRRWFKTIFDIYMQIAPADVL